MLTTAACLSTTGRFRHKLFFDKSYISVWFRITLRTSLVSSRRLVITGQGTEKTSKIWWRINGHDVWWDKAITFVVSTCIVRLITGRLTSFNAIFPCWWWWRNVVLTGWGRRWWHSFWCWASGWTFCCWGLDSPLRWGGGCTSLGRCGPFQWRSRPLCTSLHTRPVLCWRRRWPGWLWRSRRDGPSIGTFGNTVTRVWHLPIIFLSIPFLARSCLCFSFWKCMKAVADERHWIVTFAHFLIENVVNFLATLPIYTKIYVTDQFNTILKLNIAITKRLQELGQWPYEFGWWIWIHGSVTCSGQFSHLETENIHVH